MRLQQDVLDLVAAQAKKRDEILRLRRSLATMGKAPKRATIADALADQGEEGTRNRARLNDAITSMVTEAQAKIAPRKREPAGGPGGMAALERARVKAGVKLRRARA